MNPLASPARLLFRGALLIFIVTVVIGILNGMNIWEPTSNLLLTHVHSGTLGWITLAVVGAAMLIFGEGADTRTASGANQLAMAITATTVLYVIAFATGTGIFRPIAGTLMLAAIVWALVWVWRRYGETPKTTARLGTLLAMVSLTIGAVLGVLLGLLIAQGSLPGLSAEAASNLAGAHPPAMLIGYLVLAGASIVHWLLEGNQNLIGRIVMWGLFASGMVANLAFILDVEALIQVFSALEVIAIILFLVHMWPRIQPSAWTGEGNFARISVVFLAVGIGLLIYVVQLFVSGELDPETGEGPVGVLLAFDHTMFIGVMSNALFAAIAHLASGAHNRIVMWSVNGGLALFVLGLVIDVEALKVIGAPVMGLALLYGIYVYFTQLGSESVPATA